MPEALAELERLREAHPEDPLTLLQLGTIYSSQKKHEKARDAFSALIAARPELWIGYHSRGDALLALGRRAEAVADYQKALELRPKDPLILNNLALDLATAPEDKVRNGKRAVELATQAAALTEYKQDYILSTLAAAYAESGDFETAEKWSAKAVELATKQHSDALKKELESYKARKPWREALPADDEPKPKEPAPKPKSSEPKQ